MRRLRGGQSWQLGESEPARASSPNASQVLVVDDAHPIVGAASFLVYVCRADSLRTSRGDAAAWDVEGSVETSMAGTSGSVETGARLRYRDALAGLVATGKLPALPAATTDNSQHWP